MNIKLYVPFYTPKDELRKKELYSCLEHNVKTGLFSEIVLFIDDHIAPNIGSQKTLVTHVLMHRRPMFSDWIYFSKNDADLHLSICANADIIFDELSLKGIQQSLTENTFMALCRYEENPNAQPAPHSNPQWTQDIWALSADGCKRIGDDLIRESRIPFGIPRCDGKIAWVFFHRGWKVKNPCLDVVTIHRHSSTERSYSQLSEQILGGICWVSPCTIKASESEVSLQIVSLNESEPVELTITRFILRLKETAAKKAREKAATGS
jgi:hypothetical protein